MIIECPTEPMTQASLKCDSDISEKREVGDEAEWSVSSAKYGSGAAELRDGNNETFWESDGTQPHRMTIRFNKMMEIRDLKIYVNKKHDESYTPRKLSIKAGTNCSELVETDQVQLEDPEGWIHIPIGKHPYQSKRDKYLRTCVIELSVVESHQNGHNTRIRQVCIYAPRKKSGSNFQSVNMSQYQCIR